ncbi:MAG: IS110 family transposase [bacterium]|nr:IS110 family transposase [bacterium]
MENKIYIGIDLHKRLQTWVVLGEKDNTKLLSRTYPVTPESISRAVSEVKKIGNVCVALVEPVCGWIWVVKQLRELGIEVQISNPRKIRMIADSLNKTDENDAFVLARLLKTGEVALSYECSPETRKHRSLVRERCFLVNTRSALKTRLESIVTRDGNHTFINQARNRTQIIVANSEVKIHQDAISALDTIIKKVETEIEKTVKLSPDIKRLMTIPGVGFVTASTIYAEVGDFKNFKKPDNLASFAGLVPRERSSGGKQRLGSITHAGSPYLRYVLVETALRIREVPETFSLFNFYKRIKTKSGAMRARVALARKLLTIMWHMMNKQQDYVAY